MREDILKHLAELSEKWNRRCEELKSNNRSCWPSDVAMECQKDIERLIVTVVKLRA